MTGRCRRAGFGNLGIIARDRRAGDHHLGPVNVGLGVAYEDGCSQLGEPLGGGGVTKVGAADAVPQGKQHFGDPAHADAADAYKMNALNLCEHIL